MDTKGKPQKVLFLVVGPLRGGRGVKLFFKLEKSNSEKNVTTKLEVEGGGGC